MNQALSYQDIYLVPQKGIIRRRAQADISVNMLGNKFKAPWIPANMSDVIDARGCKQLAFNQYPYIMHRFGDTYNFVETANLEYWPLISISVGVNDIDRNLLKKIAENNLRIDWITIDIAHGHSVMMEDMIKYIKSINFSSKLGGYSESSNSRDLFLSAIDFKPKIIAGNIATPDAVKDLYYWGADAVKIGIAGGKVCSTKTQTGFHVPMFTCTLECYSFAANRIGIPIIADGGIRETGDVAKAIAAGATMVMAGSIFASCKDAPGDNVYEDGSTIKYKRYHGSASEHQKGYKRYVEGFYTDLLCNGMTYEEKYQELSDGLCSAVSYAGGSDLSCLKSVDYVQHTR